MANILEKHRDAASPRSNRTAFFRKVRDEAAVRKLIKDELDLGIEYAALAIPVSIPDQLDEQKTEEQRAEEVESPVLIGHDAEVSALLLARKLKVDLRIGSDVPNLFRLHDLQLAAKADDHARPHSLGRLLEDCERCGGWRRRQDFTGEFVRVLMSDALHNHGQAALAFVAEQVVYRAEIALFGREFQSDVQDQGFEQVQLSIVPERVPLIAAGILKDNIRKGLCQQLTVAYFTKAVPAVTVIHLDQIEHPHFIALIPEISAHGFVEFTFGISDDDGFSALGCLKNEVPGD